MARDQSPLLRGRLDLLAGGPPPAFAGKVPQGCGGGPVHRHCCIVKGAVSSPRGSHPLRIPIPVVARVPAVVCHVDAAAERKLVVDDDELLVMGCSGWMGVI